MNLVEMLNKASCIEEVPPHINQFTINWQWQQEYIGTPVWATILFGVSHPLYGQVDVEIYLRNNSFAIRLFHSVSRNEIVVCYRLLNNSLATCEDAVDSFSQFLEFWGTCNENQ